MTVAQYKKLIRSMSEDQLQEHCIQMFSDFKQFKELESTCWNQDDRDKLLAQLHKKLDKAFDWFGKNNFDALKGKKVLQECIDKCAHKPTIALLHLAYAKDAIDLGCCVGDFGHSFYHSICTSVEQFFKYARTDRDFFAAHEEELNQMITKSDGIIYYESRYSNVHQALVSMMEKFQEEQQAEASTEAPTA